MTDEHWARSFAEANVEIENHLPVGYFKFRSWAESLPENHEVHVRGSEFKHVGTIAGINVYTNPDCPPDKVYAFRDDYWPMPKPPPYPADDEGRA